MSNNSIGKNMILNLIKTLGTYVFPLITYPYIFRILQVDAVGRYNYAFSIISYFVLIAGLGINTYAVREGAKIRYNKSLINKFVGEILGLSISAVVFSYLLLILALFITRSLDNYCILILILSPIVAATSLSMEWILTVYEDFFFVTIRTFITNIISMLAVFVFVKDSADVYIYALIHSVQMLVIALLNISHAHKYVKYSVLMNFKQHIKPVLILFSMSVAIQIYVNVDTTMLGVLKGDRAVGLYNAANKIYSIIKTAIVALMTTFIPRLTAYSEKQNLEYDLKRYKGYLNFLLCFLILLSLPITIGTYLLKNKIVYIISGETYIEAAQALGLLAFAVPVCCISTCINSCVLIINNGEKKTLVATTIGAIVNFLMNLFFIPYLAQNGAALTTLIAEIIVLMVDVLYCIHYKELFDMKQIIRSIVEGMAGCILIIFVNQILKPFHFEEIINIVVLFFVSILLYMLFLVAVHDKTMVSVLKREIR